MAILGGARELDYRKDGKIVEELGHFAVQEYNAKQGKNLHFKRVVSAKKEVVVGEKYYLEIEAREDGTYSDKIYEAEVRQKPGEEPRSLEKFELKGYQNIPMEAEPSEREEEDPSQSDLSFVKDPKILEAAELAVKELNAKNRAFEKYILVEITHVDVEMITVANIRFSCLGKMALFCGHAGTEKELYTIRIHVSRDELEEIFDVEVEPCRYSGWVLKSVSKVITKWTYDF